VIDKLLTLAALVVLAVVALSPLAFMLGRNGAGRGRRDSALAIHRAQLAELDRELADARIAPAEHATAKLEVQRRLLAAAEAADPAPAPASPLPLLVALVAVPALAAALYAIDAHPSLPAMPFAERPAPSDKAGNAEQDAKSAALIATLRQKLATMDQSSDMARQGYLLLGNAEDSLGHLAEAAAAWRRAVAIRFDPGLAALTAEAQSRIEGKVTADSADLFRRALAEGPADAPWRQLAEQRIAQAARN
jgi:cytochrome c-type biogenesis protein CcmH